MFDVNALPLATAITVLIRLRLIAPFCARDPPHIHLNMDVVIAYDEAAGFLKNPPSVEPRPNFINLRALQKHIIQALAQLSCPQSAIHGWSGLAMDPTACLLLEGVAFTVPADPGPTVVFPGGAAVARTVMKTTEATFERDKNYFLSYKNIVRACFRLLDATVSAQYKVSNNANLTGWNSTMSIIDILAQLQNSYGKPNMMTLFNNDNLFRSPMKSGDSPETLFYRLEQCQEVQLIGQVPYSPEQIISNAIRILATANIFPLKEFNTWDLGCQLLSNYLVIPVVTVFCSQILVTLLTFDTVTGKISESKWKVTSK